MGPSGSGYDTDIGARLFDYISGVAGAYLYDDDTFGVLLYAVSDEFHVLAAGHRVSLGAVSLNAVFHGRIWDC